MCWQSPRLERSGEKLVFSPAGLVHHELLQNSPSGLIFRCRIHDVAMRRYVVEDQWWMDVRRIEVEGCHRWKTDWWSQKELGSWCSHYWSWKRVSNYGWKIVFVQVGGICSSRLGLICKPVYDFTNDSNGMDGKLYCHLITLTLTKLLYYTNSYPPGLAYQCTSKLYWKMGLPDMSSLQTNDYIWQTQHFL